LQVLEKCFCWFAIVYDGKIYETDNGFTCNPQRIAWHQGSYEKYRKAKQEVEEHREPSQKAKSQARS